MGYLGRSLALWERELFVLAAALPMTRGSLVPLVGLALLGVLAGWTACSASPAASVDHPT